MQGRTVCFICFKFNDDWSGIALSARRIVKHLVDLGYLVHVVTPVKPENTTNELFEFTSVQSYSLLDNFEFGEGVVFHRVAVLNNDGRLPANSFPIMSNVLHNLHDMYNFSIFHAFTFSATYFAINVAKRDNRPIIGSFRGIDGHSLLGSNHLLPYLRASLKGADWITSVSSDLIRNVNRLESVSHKASVILNGIDCHNMPNWDINSCSRGVIGTAAELRYKKGIHLLPEIFSRLNPQSRSAVHVIGQYSDDIEKVQVELEIQKFDISKNWHSFGYLAREDLLIEITNFHIFVIPSLHDGLPNALLEACSCGIPIVASNVSGMADILTHGKNALLCEPGDVHSFSDAINQLLESDYLCRQLSAGAKKLAEELNCANERKAWENTYNRLLGECLA